MMWIHLDLESTCQLQQTQGFDFNLQPFNSKRSNLLCVVGFSCNQLTLQQITV